MSTKAYQPVTQTTTESVFDLDESSTNYTDSYIIVDQDSTMNEVPHYDRYEEQIIIINRSNNLSPSSRPQMRYVRPSDVPQDDRNTITNRPGWQTGNPLIFHH